ncbi:MAG TPA: glycosyltransferase family 2 protein [Bryobacteraceae bacterium]|nr:glycosyltransferase family 2 protein [Bryobacteraceae bacterium]
MQARIFICLHLRFRSFPRVKLLKVAEPSGQAPKPPKVSALVVSYNRKALLRRALEALERSEARDSIEIVVVDNGSTDGSQQLESEFPRARFIRIPRNFGLTKALNLGVRGSEGDYIFFLHEDAEVFPETARLLAELLDAQPDAGAVCPLLVDAADRPAPQLGQFPPDDSWRPAAPGSDPMPVEYPRGAALMMRRFFFTAIRQIDERYGQFGSDADLCYQIRRAGKKILLAPQARARHEGRTEESALRKADRQQGTAAWIGKYGGFISGLRRQIGAIFGALGSLQLGVLKYLLANQKVDGSQQE